MTLMLCNKRLLSLTCETCFVRSFAYAGPFNWNSLRCWLDERKDIWPVKNLVLAIIPKDTLGNRFLFIYCLPEIKMRQSHVSKHEAGQ